MILNNRLNPNPLVYGNATGCKFFHKYSSHNHLVKSSASLDFKQNAVALHSMKFDLIQEYKLLATPDPNWRVWDEVLTYEMCKRAMALFTLDATVVLLKPYDHEKASQILESRGFKIKTSGFVDCKSRIARLRQSNRHASSDLSRRHRLNTGLGNEDDDPDDGNEMLSMVEQQHERNNQSRTRTRTRRCRKRTRLTSEMNDVNIQNSVLGDFM